MRRYRHSVLQAFRSRLLHQSDAPDFEIGYENHRINATFLFGQYAEMPPA